MKPCSITSSTYMTILRRTFLGRRWWIMALPVVLCLCLTAIDTRFAYVALIVAMAMVMLAMPLVFYYGLTQESRWSILEKTVTLTDDGIRLDFLSDKMESHDIPWGSIASTSAYCNCLIVRLKKNRYTFLAIPLTAFDSEAELRETVIAIRSHL